MNKLLLLCVPLISFGQLTYVPDNNFEAYLENNGMGNGIQYDDSVFTSAIDTVTYLDLSMGAGSATGIFDLTGIEDFTSISYLHCGSNNLQYLDISNNILLEQLFCNSNFLSSLDVTNNTALIFLDCNNNQIIGLDVSQNINLTNLYCHQNQLTNLSVSGAISLDSLSCYNNQLTTLILSDNVGVSYLIAMNNQLTNLDISQSSALITLSVSNNQLTTLDVSNNPVLTVLNCHNNQLTILDVSDNTALTYLNFDDNQITSLDASPNTALSTLYCEDNELTSLDLRNGNNTNISNNNFSSVGNSNLYCIDVDNTIYSSTNWTNIDSWSSFSTQCVTAYCDSIQINLISIDTLSNPKTIDFEVNPNYTTNYNFPYCGLFLLDNNGDTLAYQPLLSGNVYGISQGLIETRTLEATSNFSYFFSGVLQIVNDWHSGGPTYLACSFPIDFMPTSINNLSQKNKTNYTVLDILGKETKETKNKILFYIYNDGTVEKKIIIE